jgi:hypothetical protein
MSGLVPPSVRVFLTDPAGGCKGPDSLMTIVRDVVREDPLGGHLLVLFSRRGEGVRIPTGTHRPCDVGEAARGWTIPLRGTAPVALRPAARTDSSPGSSRHARRTACPSMPVAPKTTAFIVGSGAVGLGWGGGAWAAPGVRTTGAGRRGARGGPRVLGGAAPRRGAGGSPRGAGRRPLCELRHVG